MFPIHTRRRRGQPIGKGFGFCPGKATWYPDVSNLYDLLVLAAETGHPLYGGGIAEQPGWAIEATSWFIPEYRELQFMRRAAAVFGDGEAKPEAPVGPNDRRHPR